MYIKKRNIGLDGCKLVTSRRLTMKKINKYEFDNNEPIFLAVLTKKNCF